MKKYLPLIGLCCLIVLFIAYNTKEEQVTGGFKMYNMSHGLGGTDSNSLDESKLTYNLTISTETEDLNSVTQVEPIIGKNIADRLISNEPPQLVFHDDYIEVSGQIIFDTKGLSKEQIMALEPFIDNVKVTAEHIVATPAKDRED